MRGRETACFARAALRASYMTYDSRKRLVHWHRVPYAVERAQQRILRAGLPRVLADRLA